MPVPVEPVGVMSPRKQRSDEAFEFGKVSLKGGCEGMPAHGAECIFGIKSDHHGAVPPQVNPGLEDLVPRVCSPRAGGKLAVPSCSCHPVTKSSSSCGQKDPSPGTKDADGP
eukprot:6689563-Prorocentrum_lima.AAC.1